MEQKPSEDELKQIRFMKRMILRKGMAPEARERLGRVRAANPELAEQAETVCIQLIQQGKVVNEEVLKEILTKLNPRREIKIKRW